MLSFLILGERLGWRGVAGIAIATGGILLLVSRGRLGDLAWLRSRGDWLIVLSAHTWALYTVVTRNVARRRDPLAVTFGILFTAAALTAVLFAVTADIARISNLSPRGLFALLYLSIPGLALGQWFWQEGVGKLGRPARDSTSIWNRLRRWRWPCPCLANRSDPSSRLAAAWSWRASTWGRPIKISAA